MRKITVAIDGYSSCGKSTMAKTLAKTIGYTYVDTGAMYRAIALYALRHKYVCGGVVDKDMLVSQLGNVVITFAKDGKTQGRKYINTKEDSDSATRAELKAILMGLEKIIRPCRIKLSCRSSQTAAAINMDWIKTWKNNNWCNHKGNLIRNVDLWMKISEEIENRGIGISAEARNG